MDALLFGHRGFETSALFGAISQLSEGIGEFDSANIKLETFGDLVTARLCPCQCGQRQWVLIQYGCAVNAQIRVYPLGQNTAEHIAPGVVLRDDNAGFRRLSRKG